MSPDADEKSQRVGLALSGGGVRAAAFHAGVLQYLASREELEKVVHISSVSGGSLFVGLVLAASEYRWPASSLYASTTLPTVRRLLTTKSLQTEALLRLLLNPLNWRFLLSRANVIAQTIHSAWNIDVPLGDITRSPVWSINATTAETGRRFRFKAARMGDYELGYADASRFPLASAMAVSAAFPGGIGPLEVNPRAYQWSKRSRWDATLKEEPYAPPFARLHLYDGGLYDNLGLEPLFDVGKQQSKTDESEPIDYLIVSDAGAALTRSVLPHPLNPFRFKRIADIALDQTRALRVRSFVNFLQQHHLRGAYLQLGANPVETIKRFRQGREDVAGELLRSSWLEAESIKDAATYPTTLRRLSESDFDLIARHGYETAMWNHVLFRSF
jgi:NTE family protein